MSAAVEVLCDGGKSMRKMTRSKSDCNIKQMDDQSNDERFVLF